ncbi:outer membrane protein OmpK [Bdellovibrio sp. HCB337]|uniref:nucleoside-specific channel-forming Tsx family protein n=1 Tax=Bdellovibrio sp. HCB337 TaxID=3394358 RepID=UPI0039A5B5C2
MTVLRCITSLFLLLMSPKALAADYSDGNIRKNDYKWFQFNLYQSFDNKLPFNNKKDTFFEMEFGGRSGVFDAYGFLDVFDVLNTPNSDLHNEDNLFLKFVPRFSIDGMAKSDLSLGPIKEWYLASMFIVGDRALFQQYVGIGTDVEIPWFGKTVANLMARYVRENFGAANENKWDGVLLDIAWFKSFYTFADKTYLTYQGYFDYTFGATKISSDPFYSDSSIEWYNGLYWHSVHYAAGYGLKYYKDMGLVQSGGVAGDTTGFGHYLVVTYKF